MQKRPKFAVQLPDRANKRLKVTPPVYNYLPYYLDQDYYSGSQFESFNRLQQFKDYKADVLGYHFGVYNEEYYDLKMRVEEVEKKIKDEECREMIQDGILASIRDKLKGRACPRDLDSLWIDLEHRQKEYADIVSQMNQVRQALLETRNSLYDLNEVEGELADFESENEGMIQVLNRHRCPECHTVLHDTGWLRSPRYNLAENLVLLKRDLQVNRETLMEEVKKGESRYVELTRQLELLEQEIGMGSSDIKELLRFQGLSEVYEDSVRESCRVHENLEGYEKELATLKKAIACFRKKRVLINKEYETSLSEDSVRLGLKKIKKERFKSYELNFNAGGSDKCLATVMWHFAILRVRNKFNAQAIKFPIVFDSPNNVESDEEKTKLLIGYLLDNASLSGQFIMSGIGLKDNEAISLQNRSDIHWVVLESEQYHLLQEDDYDAYLGVMDVLIATGREKC